MNRSISIVFIFLSICVAQNLGLSQSDTLMASIPPPPPPPGFSQSWIDFETKMKRDTNLTEVKIRQYGIEFLQRGEGLTNKRLYEIANLFIESASEISISFLLRNIAIDVDGLKVTNHDGVGYLNSNFPFYYALVNIPYKYSENDIQYYLLLSAIIKHTMFWNCSTSEIELYLLNHIFGKYNGLFKYFEAKETHYNECFTNALKKVTNYHQWPNGYQGDKSLNSNFNYNGSGFMQLLYSK